MIDGVDIKNYSHQALHRLITIVQQEPVLFARSIKENILYGELNIKEDEEEHEIDVAVTKGMQHMYRMHSMTDRKFKFRALNFQATTRQTKHRLRYTV